MAFVDRGEGFAEEVDAGHRCEGDAENGLVGVGERVAEGGEEISVAGEGGGELGDLHGVDGSSGFGGGRRLEQPACRVYSEYIQ